MYVAILDSECQRVSEMYVRVPALIRVLLPSECMLVTASLCVLYLLAFKSEANGRKSTRPVLKHGPRSSTCAQVIGYYET